MRPTIRGETLRKTYHSHPAACRHISQRKPSMPASPSPVPWPPVKEPHISQRSKGRARNIHHLVAASRAADQIAIFLQGAALAGRLFRRIEAVPTERTLGQMFAHIPHPKNRRIRFKIPPTRKAMGMIRISMPAALPQLCSLAIIMTLAMHGMNKVMVTMATTT